MLERLKIFNGSQLKMIAMISMLLDHVNKGIITIYLYFYNGNIEWLIAISKLCDILGRIAFPIFLFLLVEGYFHTHSKVKYLINLLVFAVISEIPYDMFLSGTYLEFNAQNMMFTLALALVTIWIIDEYRNKIGKFFFVFLIVFTLVSAYLCSYLAFDYMYYGILIPVLFYVFHENVLEGTMLSYLIVIKETWSVLGFGLCNLYNGERGKMNKWIGYCFYPAHLFIIGLIRMFILRI